MFYPASSVASSLSSAAEAESSCAVATSVSTAMADDAVRRFPLAIASIAVFRAARAAGATASDASHCLVLATLAVESPGLSRKGGSMLDARRAVAKHANVTSRSPPRAARPACEASALNLNPAEARAKGGGCPINFSSGQ